LVQARHCATLSFFFLSFFFFFSLKNVKQDLFKTKVPATHNLVRGVSAPTNTAAPPVNLPPLPPLKHSTATKGPRRPLAAKGLPGSAAAATTAPSNAVSSSPAKKARPTPTAVPPPGKRDRVVAATIAPVAPSSQPVVSATGKRERGATTSRSASAAAAAASAAAAAASASAQTSMLDDHEDGEVIDKETAAEGTDWLKRESKRAEADKTFAEIVGVASPKRARISPHPGTSDVKPVRAAKAAAAIAVAPRASSSTTRAAAAAATPTAATPTPTATDTARLSSSAPTAESAAPTRASTTASTTRPKSAEPTATVSPPNASANKMTDKQRSDSMQLQAKKLKHLGDAMLKDSPDEQERKEAYQSLLSAGLLWLESVSVNNKPRDLLKSTANYFAYHISNLDSLPRYASCFLRCRAVTLAQLARCNDVEFGKQVTAQTNKQIDAARSELKAHGNNPGNAVRKFFATDGPADQIVRHCDALNDAREKWSRAAQLWQAEGCAPLAWPGDGDFISMPLPDFVEFVRKNLALLLGE
jgi:hypothetical protein